MQRAQLEEAAPESSSASQQIARQIHAAWAPGSWPNGGRLFVWGLQGIDETRKMSPSGAEDVSALLAELCRGPPPQGRARRRLRLPRVHGAAPVPPAAPADFATRTIDGVELSSLEAVQLLTRLAPSRPGLPSPSSPSLASWAQTARLALELLVRQKYVPRIGVAENQRFAVWRPVLSDPDDLARVTAATKAMPAVAFVLAGDRPARAVVDDFITSLVDAGVRAACAGARLEESAPPEGIGAAWARALFSADGLMPPETPGVSDKLVRLVDDWAAPVAVRSSFRTCLRLDPPPPPDEAALVVAPDHGWNLRYGLQSVDDPSLVVPADSVWRPFGAAPFDAWGLADPQEALLQGLGVAARLWSKVAESLDAPMPSGVELSADEAEHFSREVAPRLAEAGLGVLVPGIRPLLAALRAQLEVKSKREPNPSDAPSRFGLRKIIQFDLKLALGGQPLSEEEMDLLVSLKAPLLRIRGQWVAIGPGDIEKARRLWHRRQELTLQDALAIAGDGKFEEVQIDSIVAEGWLASLFGHQADAAAETAPPPGLRAELRPYQARGLSWLMTMRRAGLGALLADDMGLGKTLQVLASELAARQGQTVGPTLVVCPASVATNWRMEAKKFTPDLRVVIHHGPDRAKGRAFEARAEETDLVITTYALLLRDLDLLGKVPWSSLVLDEAQNIKTASSQQAQAARQLQASVRVAMTGTPVENRLAELWSIYQFLNPGYLGSLFDFRRRYALPIERYADPDAATKMVRLVRPFLLRRLKTDPAIAGDLPEKHEMNTFVPLTREQATLYEGVVRDSLARIEQAASGIERQGIVLSMLIRLKQVCNHPAHFLADGSRLEGRSGKMERLCEMLEEAIGEGDRCLIFTQFREMGELLQRHLSHRFGEFPFLHGGTPRSERDRMVAAFQDENGPPIFLLSLKAGGTGLNLTAANRVFHFDRWWNPAVEDQATDRAFRIGQKRRVQVHKFVCAGTIEEKIDEALRDKRALADRIVGAGETWITELTNRELRELLKLRPDAIEEGAA